MAEVVITSVPIHGHVTPLLAVAEGLVRAGHRVRFLTGSRFADAVRGTGATHVSLPGRADFDVREVDRREDERGLTGVAGLRADVHRLFLAPARDQRRALLDLLRTPTDVVLTEPAFVGSVLLAGTPRADRPPVVGLGVLPLLLSSRHTPPYGLGLAPLRGPLNVVRNTLLRVVAERVVFRPVQQDFDALWREVHGRRADCFVFNGLSVLDAVVQLSVPSFEYPRPDAPVPLHFCGPVARSAASALDEPSWWRDLAPARPVVLVTQGTVANDDLTELVRPTVDGLAGEDVLVVVTTGGPPVADLGPLPDNVRAAAFLPYDRLFDHVDVFVTNGGYGGVHFALAHGTPMVVAGVTEDKPEVAARVAWSGTGVNLRTARPSPQAVREAVRTVLDDPSFRRNAQRVANDIAEAGGMDLLLEVVDRVRTS
jgi:UDP:flavonoid glycosyltransferase YjiC (YdhE family)